MIIFRIPHFVFTQSIFSQVQISLSKFAFFTTKSTNVTQKSVSQENAFKKSENPSAFFRNTIDSNNSLTLIENNFRFLSRLNWVQ